MAWVKLDDALGDDPRLLATGVVGVGVLALALCYGNRNLTNGWVPATVLRRWLAEGGFAEGAADVTTRLLQSGVIAAAERDGIEGYQAHRAYVRLQPTRAQVMKQRRERSRQKAAAGRVGGLASWHARRTQTTPARVK